MDKQKILYICLAVLLFVIIINMNKKTRQVCEQPRKQEEIILREQEAMEPTAYSVFPKSAISIVHRPAPKEKIKTIPLANERENKLAENPRLGRQSVSPSSGSSGSSSMIGDTDQAPGAPSAGITKINKYPSKEEVKQMNEQGIVMY